MSLQSEYDTYLAHHGVKGMRWGHRKPEQIAKEKRRRSLKRVRTMSDEELNKRIQRLKKEKELRDLTESDTAPGRNAVKKLLIGTGTAVAGAALTGATMYALHNLKNGFYKKEVKASKLNREDEKLRREMGDEAFGRVWRQFRTGDYSSTKTKTAFSFKKYAKAFQIGDMFDRMFSKKKK